MLFETWAGHWGTENRCAWSFRKAWAVGRGHALLERRDVHWALGIAFNWLHNFYPDVWPNFKPGRVDTNCQKSQSVRFRPVGVDQFYWNSNKCDEHRLWFFSLQTKSPSNWRISNILFVPILEHIYVTLDHKISLKLLGYICSNSHK